MFESNFRFDFGFKCSFKSILFFWVEKMQIYSKVIRNHYILIVMSCKMRIYREISSLARLCVTLIKVSIYGLEVYLFQLFSFVQNNLQRGVYFPYGEGRFNNFFYLFYVKHLYTSYIHYTSIRRTYNEQNFNTVIKSFSYNICLLESGCSWTAQ